MREGDIQYRPLKWFDSLGTQNNTANLGRGRITASDDDCMRTGVCMQSSGYLSIRITGTDLVMESRRAEVSYIVIIVAHLHGFRPILFSSVQASNVTQHYGDIGTLYHINQGICRSQGYARVYQVNGQNSWILMA